MLALGSPLAFCVTPVQTRAGFLGRPDDAFGSDGCILVVIVVNFLGYHLLHDSIAAVIGDGDAAAAAATAVIMIGVVPKSLFGFKVHGSMQVLRIVLGALVRLCGT